MFGFNYIGVKANEHSVYGFSSTKYEGAHKVHGTDGDCATGCILHQSKKLLK